MLPGTRKPQLDADGVVWPVMFIYPETMQNDAIEAFHEHHALSDHLDAMFGEHACTCFCCSCKSPCNLASASDAQGCQHSSVDSRHCSQA